MKRAFAIAAVLAAGFTAPAAHAATVVFSEDFSSSSAGNVATSIPRYGNADAAFSGGAHLSFRNTGGVQTYDSGAIDVSGFTSLTLSFDYFAQGEWELDDSIEAQVSLDGGAFSTLFSLAGNAASPVASNASGQALQLTSFSQGLGDASSVVFRFLVDASAKKEVAGLDNILLTGSPLQISDVDSEQRVAPETPDVAPAPVPVPASVLFLLGGIGALGAMRARRKS